MNSILKSQIFDLISQKKDISNCFFVLECHFFIKIYVCDMLGNVKTGNKTSKFTKWIEKISNTADFLKYINYESIIPNELIDHNKYSILRLTSKSNIYKLIIIEIPDQIFPPIEEIKILIRQLYNYYSSISSLVPHQTQDSLLHSIARELFLSDDTTVEMLIKNDRILKNSFKPPYYVLALDNKAKSDNRRLIDRISSVFFNSICLETEHCILVFLFGNENYLYAENLLLCKIDAICTQEKTWACLSNRFSEISHRKEYVEQVTTMLDIIKETKRDKLVFTANDLYFEYVHYTLQKNNYMNIFTIPAFVKLERHDALHKTLYLNTLESYLFNHNNAAKAAAKMYIDRTTLKYRIKKIKEIIDLDVDDPLIALNLRIAMRIYKSDISA